MLLLYEAVTKDGKRIKIYDNGTCEGDFEFECCINHFEVYINMRIAKDFNELKKTVKS